MYGVYICTNRYEWHKIVMKGPVFPFSDINIMNTEQSKVTKTTY